MNNLLSVIIPGHDTTEELWCRCIESVLICGVDEVVCIDDGSTQRPEFLHQMAQVDSRIKVVFKDACEGPGATRNAGFSLATGQYVTFVDSDDVVFGKALTLCVEKLEQTGADIALYGAETIWPDEGLKKVDLPEDDPTGELSPSEVRWFYEHCLLNCVWGKVYRRSFLESGPIRFDPLAITGEDLIFNLTCLRHRPRWCFVPLAGYRYFRTHTTLLSKYKKNLIEGFHAWNHAWELYEQAIPEAKAVLNGTGRFTETELIRMEWKNLWMTGSPVGLRARWSYLTNCPNVFPSPLKTFVKQMVFSFIRKHFYVKIARRCHIRKLFPTVVDV